MATTADAQPPAGLGDAGRALWDRITDTYELEQAEIDILERACRTADELAILETALASADVVVKGSTGQLKPNPLFAEVRHHRALLSKLLKQAGLFEAGGDDESESAPGESKTTTAARKAARARWGTR